MCDYSDAYIVVKARVSVTGNENPNRRNKKLTFKNNVPIRSCIWKIDNTLIDNAEDLDIIVWMFNLLEYSDIFSITSQSLWNYYGDEVGDSANETDDNDNMINNKTTRSKSFIGIVKRDEPCKCDIYLRSRILWHERITPSLKEWRFWYLICTSNFLPFPCKFMQHHSSEGCLFSSEKNLWYGLKLELKLEASKKQVPQKSYDLEIRIDSVDQILKNKEKVT